MVCSVTSEIIYLNGNTRGWILLSLSELESGPYELSSWLSLVRSAAIRELNQLELSQVSPEDANLMKSSEGEDRRIERFSRFRIVIIISTGRFSYDDGDGHENAKKKTNKQTNNSARAFHFLVNFFAVTARQDVKFPDGMFCGGRKHTTANFIFLFLNLGAVSKNSTPGNFTYIWHLKRIGITARMFQKTRIHFNNDVFAAVDVVLAKAPLCLACNSASSLACPISCSRVWELLI